VRYSSRWLLVLLTLASVHLAEAQQPQKIPRIGYLTLSSSSPSPLQEAFRDGLRQLGYVEGQNLHIEYRYAAGKAERLKELAAELVVSSSM
jgi:putative ABC transport system substrate-binding protein